MASFTFNNGNNMPAMGVGTYLSQAGYAEIAAQHAIDIGYRHTDTATLYENEKVVDVAIREKIEEGVFKREDIFVTTKRCSNTHEVDQVGPTFKKFLKNLGLDYVDLYLIHWPFNLKVKY